MKKYLVILVFAAAVFWYLPGAGLGYVCDDFFYLQGIGWRDMIGLDSNLVNVDGSQVKHFRPIPMVLLSVWVNMELPHWVPHLWNILIHALNGALVFVLLRMFFRESVSFAGALVWIMAPVQADAVYSITGIFNLLFTMFTILFLIGIRRGSFRMTMAAMIGAVLSYEQGFALCLLMPWIWKRRGWWFVAAAGAIGTVRHLLIGGVGVYGMDYVLRALNPLNWVNTAGYYLKILL